MEVLTINPTIVSNNKVAMGLKAIQQLALAQVAKLVKEFVVAQTQHHSN